MRTLRVTLFSLVVLCCIPAVHAQEDTIYLKVSGLSCNTPGSKGTGEGLKVTSWDIGFANPSAVSIGTGTAAGKATASGLVVVRPFDECSPELLPNLFTGKGLATVTLTQYGAGSAKAEAGSPLMVVTLTNAAISSYSIGGNATTDPAETWTFQAQTICIKNLSNNAQACWDFKTNTQ
jgi:type VI protein secretion system component Hcp